MQITRKKWVWIIISLVAIGFVIVIWAVQRASYSAAVIEELETKYNLSFQDAEIKKAGSIHAQDVTDRIMFNVSDYQTFMDTFRGEICNCSEAEDGSAAQYKCKPYPNSSDSLTKRLTFQIKFQHSDSGYNAVLTSYYE